MNNPELVKLNEIAVKVGSLEATQAAQADAMEKMANGIERLVDRLDRSDDIARKAEQRADAAHKRIDDTNRRVDDTNDAVKDIRKGQRWLIGTLISTAALFIATLGLLWKVVEK